jgi:Protein of unknown function (DUF1580)
MIDSTREQLIALSDVPKHLPARRGGKKVHVSSVFRWAQRGCKGVKLEALQAGGTKVTSAEALQRFFEKLTAAASGEPLPVRSSAAQSRAIKSAAAELESAGI